MFKFSQVKAETVGCSILIESCLSTGVVVKWLTDALLFCNSTRLPCPWDFPRKNTEVSFHFLLQGIFPTQGSNACLLCWQMDSLPLGSHGKPRVLAFGALQKLFKVENHRTEIRARSTASQYLIQTIRENSFRGRHL